MNATERIRELLDERGVRYAFERVSEGTLFHVSTDGESYYFILVRDDDAGIEMWSQHLTPEQAVEATLGRGECHRECYDIDMLDGERSYWCSACHSKRIRYGDKYCPNCGAKVVSE